MGEDRVEKRVLLDAAGVAAAVDGMARELREVAAGGPFAVIGIQTGGVHLAQRLRPLLRRADGREPEYGLLDITLYRDDIGMGLQQPQVRRTEIPFDLTGKGVVLVDDVLYTGRTVRAALDALVDFGRPRFIRLAVLVDRGLREYPIQPDCVGLVTPTSPDETVRVELVEMGLPADRVVVWG
jgi:pyrimidine operon attenuation protein/uracil phosphoribosyltransferase